MAKDGASLNGFNRARPVRSFDDVTAQIREAIVDGRIGFGERLPSERELCEAFGVSRPTVREALRSLEAAGIIEIRAGAKGGSFVTQPSEQTLGTALATLVNFRGASTSELAEFRVAFEAENASLAAKRRDAEDLVELNELIAEAREAAKTAESWEPLAAIDVRWHEALARATKNSIRVGISLGIHEAQMRYVRTLRPSVERYRRSISRDIAQITVAVEAGDAEKAGELMRKHLTGWNRHNRRLQTDEPGIDPDGSGQASSRRASASK